jgi:hypothetical protein
VKWKRSLLVYSLLIYCQYIVQIHAFWQVLSKEREMCEDRGLFHNWHNIYSLSKWHGRMVNNFGFQELSPLCSKVSTNTAVAIFRVNVCGREWGTLIEIWQWRTIKSIHESGSLDFSTEPNWLGCIVSSHATRDSYRNVAGFWTNRRMKISKNMHQLRNREVSTHH